MRTVDPDISIGDVSAAAACLALRLYFRLEMLCISSQQADCWNAPRVQFKEKG